MRYTPLRGATMHCCLRHAPIYRPSPSRDAVKFLIGELREVRKTQHLTVHVLSADFAAASENSGKNLCCLLKIDITSVIDANENEHTSRRYAVVVLFW